MSIHKQELVELINQSLITHNGKNFKKTLFQLVATSTYESVISVATQLYLKFMPLVEFGAQLPKDFKDNLAEIFLASVNSRSLSSTFFCYPAKFPYVKAYISDFTLGASYLGDAILPESSRQEYITGAASAILQFARIDAIYNYEQIYPLEVFHREMFDYDPELISKFEFDQIVLNKFNENFVGKANMHNDFHTAHLFTRYLWKGYSSIADEVRLSNITEQINEPEWVAMYEKWISYNYVLVYSRS